MKIERAGPLVGRPPRVCSNRAYRLVARRRTTVAAVTSLAMVCAVLVSSGPACVWAAQPDDGPEAPPVGSTGLDAASDATAVRPDATGADDDDAGNDAISAEFVRPTIRSWTSADLPQANVLSARPVSRLRVHLEDRLPLGRSGPYGRSDYLAIIAREAAAADIPRELVEAVMAVESGFDPTAVGAAGEIGLMQIMPATARMLGFSGTLAELADPRINVVYGTAYLAGAWRLANHDICTAAMKYRAGHGETQFSFKSVDYCVRVRAQLAALGFPVTGSIPQATFGQPDAAGPRGRSAFRRSIAQLDFQQLNAQLRQATARVVLAKP